MEANEVWFYFRWVCYLEFIILAFCKRDQIIKREHFLRDKNLVKISWVIKLKLKMSVTEAELRVQMEQLFDTIDINRNNKLEHSEVRRFSLDLHN